MRAGKRKEIEVPDPVCVELNAQGTHLLFAIAFPVRCVRPWLAVKRSVSSYGCMLRTPSKVLWCALQPLVRARDLELCDE